jgi:S-formylglutathione hydrolase FrmB
MALIRCDFFSEVLEVGTSMTVLLPQPSEEQIGIATGSTTPEAAGDFPVLYLLHGLSDDSSAWLRYTSIERYAAPLGLAVVMPQVQRSFYADEVHGERFFTFLSDELPEVVRRFFRVSGEREDTFVAGLSMGGYGALKWALHRPGRFAAAASLSGALDLEAVSHDEWRKPLMQRVFDGRVGPRDDLFALLGDADVESLPSLYVGCGTEDHLYEHNVRFVDAATAAGVDVHVDFRAGEHEWGVWDATIGDVLAWLPLRR